MKRNKSGFLALIAVVAVAGLFTACKATGSAGDLFSTLFDQTIEVGYGQYRKLEPTEIKLLKIPEGTTTPVGFAGSDGNPIAFSDGKNILGVLPGKIEEPTYTLKVYETDWDETHEGTPAWPEGDDPASTAKAITAFAITAPAASTGPAVISEAAHTVTVTVPGETALNNMTVDVTHTGASISPAADAAGINFSAPQTFTVTAGDGTTQQYVVTVTAAGSGESAGILVTPPISDITKGEERQFVAIDVQTSSATTAVNWSIEGPHLSGTYISSGTLKVDANETAGSIVVKATLQADDTKTGTANVTPVYDQPTSVITIEPISGIQRPTQLPGMYGTPGTIAKLRTTVLPATANPAVVWTSSDPEAIEITSVEFDSDGYYVVTLTRRGSTPGPTYADVRIRATTVGTPTKTAYIDLCEYILIGGGVGGDTFGE
jgi:hypothetical protein